MFPPSMTYSLPVIEEGRSDSRNATNAGGRPRFSDRPTSLWEVHLIPNPIRKVLLRCLDTWSIAWNNGIGLTNHSHTAYDPTRGYRIPHPTVPTPSVRARRARQTV